MTISPSSLYVIPAALKHSTVQHTGLNDAINQLDCSLLLQSLWASQKYAVFPVVGRITHCSLWICYNFTCSFKCSQWKHLWTTLTLPLSQTKSIGEQDTCIHFIYLLTYLLIYLHRRALLFLWHWPWPDDLDIRTWPTYSDNVPQYQNEISRSRFSKARRSRTDRQTDKRTDALPRDAPH